jgi:hypothetical protein
LVTTTVDTAGVIVTVGDLVTDATVVVFACSVVIETIVDVSVTRTRGVLVEVIVTVGV